MNDLDARIQALPPVRRALLEKLRASQSGNARNGRAQHEPPVTPVERAMAAVWAEVLGRDAIGRQDNFFELGGDSIQSIQIVAKSRQYGLEISTQQIFTEPILCKLAAITTSVADNVDQSPVIGAAPLGPVQRWFFAQPFPHAEYWNQSVLLEAPDDVKPESLTRALTALAQHHDALRLRFHRTEDGWSQQYAPEGDIPLTVVDLELITDADAITKACNSAQASLDLQSGPVFRAVLIRGDGGNRLFLTAHHLIADGISFRILIEDLQRLLDQIARGGDMQLPLKTASYGSWSTAVGAADSARNEANYWEHIPKQAPVPIDEQKGENLEGSAAVEEAILSIPDTQSILRLPASMRVDMRAVLLGSLGEAFRRWSPQQRTLLVTIEGHGRDQLPGLPNVSRTVGWFTSLFPFAVREHSSDLASGIRAVHQDLALVPGMGIHYIAWREQHDGPVTRPEVLFNYLGQFDGVAAATRFRLAREDAGSQFHPDNPRPQVLQFVCAVYQGRLILRCIYSRNLHRPETIRKLLAFYADALRCISGNSTVVDESVTTEDLRVLAERYRA